MANLVAAAKRTGVETDANPDGVFHDAVRCWQPSISVALQSGLYNFVFEGFVRKIT